jgi:hypothetical protein
MAGSKIFYAIRVLRNISQCKLNAAACCCREMTIIVDIFDNSRIVDNSTNVPAEKTWAGQLRTIWRSLDATSAES